MTPSERSGIEIVEVDDETSPLADEAVALIERTFDPRDRQSGDELRAEIAEKRLDLIAPFGFHLLVARESNAVVGVALGVYLAGVNAGFVHYLAVSPTHRGRGIGRVLRPGLVTRFIADAKNAGQADLNWVVGEVRLDNPWMRGLVSSRGAIPFDFTYYHPGMRPGGPSSPYVLYRQPIADHTTDLPIATVRRLLYAVYRRAYRVRYPLQHPGFAAMLDQLEGRSTVGMHPAFTTYE